MLDHIIVTKEEAGERLDKLLAKRFEDKQSRSYFQRLIEDGLVLLNGAQAKKREKLDEGDEIEIQFTLTPEIDLTPENIALDILYEDDDILAINKPAGMVVHPAVGNWSGTFVNALLYHCHTLSGGDSLRPGIVHRLDKDTSGVLLAAKNALAQQRLVALFAKREIQKEYLAVSLGNPGDVTISEAIVRHPVHRQKMTTTEVGGKHAVSHFKTLSFDGKISTVRVSIETGRTHQIRVHMKHNGTPILGDSVYGNLQANKKESITRQLLHAELLRFCHPMTGVSIEIRAPLPADMMHFFVA